MIICNRCVMDDYNDSSIQFDKDGNCNYCNDAIKRMPNEYHPNSNGMQMWLNVLSRIKEEGKNKDYDCVVGISGGLDSSYVLFMGYEYKLRMLGIHLDDGFDTDLAKKNIERICKKTDTRLVRVSPDPDQYSDLIRSMFEASLPNPAGVQDSIIQKAISKLIKREKIAYSLCGSNFSLESILRRNNTQIPFADKKHIKSVHKQFGNKTINWDQLSSILDHYVFRKYFSSYKTVTPLNYINYNLSEAIIDLKDFCGYEYYGGKHYESRLTRFIQCYYLPVKFGVDKRKSHFSSMIVSGQMTRSEALKQLQRPPYQSEEMLFDDMEYIAKSMGVSIQEFQKMLEREPRQPDEYPHSVLVYFAPLARKLRRFLGYNDFTLD